MVVGTFIMKKRQLIDVNNINFITNLPAVGESNGFPIYPEITDPRFLNHDTIGSWAVDHYKQPAVDDIYGFYTSFYVRPGARKIRHHDVQIVIEQHSGDYIAPTFFTSFFGLRPVFYDPRSNGPMNTPTPIQDHFNLFPTQLLTDTTLQRDLSNRTPQVGVGPGNPEAPTLLLEAANVLPPPIEYDPLEVPGGGFHRSNLFDLAMVMPLKTLSVFSKGSDTYSTHTLQSNHQLDLPDIFNFPQGIMLELKLQVYCYDIVMLDSASNDDTPIVELIQSDSVKSFVGQYDIT